jgi:hypothetical protein
MKYTIASNHVKQYNTSSSSTPSIILIIGLNTNRPKILVKGKISRTFFVAFIAFINVFQDAEIK